MTTAIGYGRVSTTDQATNGHSLDVQQSTIERAANDRKWSLRWIADEGFSAKSPDRPGIIAALAALRHKQADALVVTSMDRLSRSLLDATGLIRRAESEGWNLVILDLGRGLSTPTGKAMASMVATFAELEPGYSASAPRTA